MQHCRRHERCCRFTVGASDAEHRSWSANPKFLNVVSQLQFRRDSQTHLFGSCHYMMAFRNSGCRCKTSDAFQSTDHCRLVGRINKFTVQSSCKIFMLFRSFIVGENHCLATLMQCVRDCHSCHPKTKHQCCLLYTQRKPACRVKSAIKIATAVATQMPEMIQNRMITVVSGQPLNSK